METGRQENEQEMRDDEANVQRDPADEVEEDDSPFGEDSQEMQGDDPASGGS